MAKKVKGVFKGHTFLVVNRWFGGLKFYHNDRLIEHNKKLLALDKNKPFISETIIIEKIPRLVEVYAYAVTSVKIQIRIDGRKIAGDDF